MSIKPTNIPKCHPRQSADSAGNFSSHRKLGELTENIRTFALPFENQPYTFKMQYEYDSWNRIQKMTYPDGEEVHYEYNPGGMLEKMSGNKNGVQYTYIDSLAYNEFELKEAVFYGNGTRAYYNYDVLQRLSHLRSECADGVMQDLYYDYDDVSNITSIGNQAGTLSNGLGGNYSNRYRYDNLYRLVNSDGEWAGERYLHYNMEMSYLKNGRLRHKRLDTETWIDGTPVPVNYNNNYSYDENQQPNTVRGIYGSHHHEMQWDAKGNMVFHRNHHAGYDRRLCWDEQNRLQGVKDDEALSFYMYDANGDRTYKLAQDLNRQNQSGRWRVYHNMLKPTLYASPYLVATRHGYTKHYYAESERVASRIGGGGLHDLDEIVDEKMFHDHRYRANMLFQRVQECMEAAMETEESPLRHLYDWRDINEDETRCYWYHTDHLGGSSWITYTDGSAVEHLHYLPWGEDFVRQRHTNYHARYTFSGKEKDAETGYSYFGSRYYSSELSIWLSVDPQSDKYPSFSPYVYCANNPIKLVDPNGEEVGDFFDYNGRYLGTDGIDDGKIYITTQENWDNCSQLEGGMTLITISQLGLSKEPSRTNLSDNAILSILSFYNTTDKRVVDENRLDNSLLTMHVISGKLTANTSNWRWNEFLDNSYDIKSTFDHEKGHFKQRKEIGVDAMLKMPAKECEKYAIDYQQNQSNYNKTSSNYKRNVENLKTKTK